MHHEDGFYSSMDIWQRFHFETCKQNVLFHSQWNFPSLGLRYFTNSRSNIYLEDFSCTFVYFLLIGIKMYKSTYVTGTKEGRKKSSLFFEYLFIYGISVQKPMKACLCT